MNRIVVMTGSTRGIGFLTATEFLKSGDQVVIFRCHKGHVMEAIDQLAGDGERQNILGFVADVRGRGRVLTTQPYFFLRMGSE